MGNPSASVMGNRGRAIVIGVETTSGEIGPRTPARKEASCFRWTFTGGRL